MKISSDEQFSLMRIGAFMKKQTQIYTPELIQGESDIDVLKNLLMYYSQENALLKEQILELYAESSKL